MAALFVPNAGFADEFFGTDTTKDTLETITAKAHDIAEQIAPRASGDYADGIEHAVARINGCWVGRLAGTDFKSGWIEFGTGAPTPAHAVLRRAAEAATGRPLV